MNARPILLVEDNADDVALTQRAFRKAQIPNGLVVARDGEEALDMLLGPTPISPSVVLLDLRMPRIGGLEVLKRLRADPRTKLLPVVVLTSSAEQRDIVESYGLGANSYIRKPVDFEQFVRAVEQLSLYWLLLNEPAPQGGARGAS